MMASEFMGKSYYVANVTEKVPEREYAKENKRDSKLNYFYRAYHAQTERLEHGPLRDGEPNYAELLTAELAYRSRVDDIFWKAATFLFEDEETSRFALEHQQLPRNFECMRTAVNSFEEICGLSFAEPYASDHMRFFINVC